MTTREDRDDYAGPYSKRQADLRSRATLKLQEEARAARTDTPSMWREGVAGAPDGVWPGKQHGPGRRVSPIIGIATHAFPLEEAATDGEWYTQVDPDTADTEVEVDGEVVRTPESGRRLPRGTLKPRPDPEEVPTRPMPTREVAR